MLARPITLVAALVLPAVPAAAHAAFPGANGKIMVDTGANLETINPDGTGQTLLATDANQGEWSSDGTKVAFERCTPTCHIWSMSSDGTGQAQVTNGPGELRPSWSPGGSRILFTRSQSEIWTVGADGTGEVLAASGLRDLYDTPRWSPDGAKIVFSSDHRFTPPSALQRDIYTVHPDGTELNRLTTVTTMFCDGADDTSGPDWSPDGRKIVYVFFQDTADGECEGGSALHVMNADGTVDHEIVNYYINDPVEGPPFWSPDGTQVVYDGSAGTFTVDAGGGPERLVTWNGLPSDWQPLPVNIPSSYARPKGASPSYISLVPAYLACTAANRAHGAPLAYGSCAAPVRTSSKLTVGSPDANGKIANSLGFFQLITQPGTPGGPDDADVAVGTQVKSVYKAADLTDYTGELEARATIRLTDKQAGISSTAMEFPLSFAIPCTATADANTGSTCTLISSADALHPGLVPEGQRSIWALDQARIYDGGADGDAATTGDNQLFEAQGVFVP
jgi:Tol biopolymer transport system component